jgi:general stress protein 26
MEFKVTDNKRIGEIIGSIQIGMLTTIQANGELRSRPMLCANFDFDSLWFLVKASKPLVADSVSNSAANVTFANPEKKLFASVTGSAQLVEDAKLVQKLWRSEMKAWFPAGLQESDLAVLRVDIHHAEAWDGNMKAEN